jgi:hypothetical protein
VGAQLFGWHNLHAIALELRRGGKATSEGGMLFLLEFVFVELLFFW